MPKTAKCPKCDAGITLPKDAELSEIITCDECSADLEIKSLDDPISLEDAPPVQEDWGE